MSTPSFIESPFATKAAYQEFIALRPAEQAAALHVVSHSAPPSLSVPTFGHFIGGKETSSTGETIDVLSPSGDRRVVSRVAAGTAADVEAAVAAAVAAQPAWAAWAPAQREKLFFDVADLLEQQKDTFGALRENMRTVHACLHTRVPWFPNVRAVSWLIDEGGSTVTKASFETSYTPSLLRAAGGEARRLYGDTFPADKPDRLSIVVREPLGVVAAISPFNAPLVLLVKMIAFPLAVGNTVVAKPSEETPAVALELVRLFHRAGLPPGVFNVVTGLGRQVGEPLVAHPKVGGITFTGSTTVGRKIAAIASERMARVHMELGGKNPVVVLRDADVHAAAKLIALGAFTHAGQICMSSSRIIAEKCIARPLAEALASVAKAMKLGDLRDPSTAYGPLINEAALQKVTEHCRSALAAGAELLAGGNVHEGLTFQPTVFFEPPRTSSVWTEETFGPVTSVVAVENLDEAIAVANESEYGLSAAILSDNLTQAVAAARRIRCGSVHIGTHSFQSDTMAPIGGFGLSSLGRSGGKYSAEHFTELKWISINNT